MDESGSTETPHDPGQRGGPGTLRGVDYQVRTAVYRAVGLIRRHFGAPHLPLTITLERLIRLRDGKSEKWDIVVEPPRERVEAKVAPTGSDLRRWLGEARAVRGVGAVLVYGQATGAIKPLVRLKQRANETASEIEFDLAMAAHGSTREHELADLLGEDAYDVLRALRLEFLPESQLTDLILATAEPFAGGEGAVRLASLLCDTFLGSGARRTIHPISSLVEKARASGIALVAPPFPNSLDLSSTARSILALTQRLPAPISIDLLAGVFRTSRDELMLGLQALLHAERISIENDQVGPGLPCEAVNDPAGEEVEGRLLGALLDHIELNRRSTDVDAQVDNALELARYREQTHPEVVAHVFPVVDKLLKRRGDRRLVYLTADRSIRAANSLGTSSEHVVKDLAVSLICGRSWAYQRRGELGKARADGDESLRIGEAIGWDRNTAFCHKCLGRLRRLEAVAGDPRQLLPVLEESAASLMLSIAEFDALGEAGEVGDAYSLLGRTYVEAGRIADAERAIAEADIRLTDVRDKDYMDLQILRGDIATSAARFDEAEAHYNRAIAVPGSDAAKNEIRARALHQRGLNYRARGELTKARSDFEEAAAIFDAFEDIDAAATAHLEVLKLDGSFPTDELVLEVLADELPPVQVAAVRLHSQREATAAPASGHVVVATEQQLTRWRVVVKDARKDVETRRHVW